MKISAKEGRYETEIKDGIKIVLKSCNIILVKWTIVLTCNSSLDGAAASAEA